MPEAGVTGRSLHTVSFSFASLSVSHDQPWCCSFVCWYVLTMRVSGFRCVGLHVTWLRPMDCRASVLDVTSVAQVLAVEQNGRNSNRTVCRGLRQFARLECRMKSVSDLGSLNQNQALNPKVGSHVGFKTAPLQRKAS